MCESSRNPLAHFHRCSELDSDSPIVMPTLAAASHQNSLQQPTLWAAHACARADTGVCVRARTCARGRTKHETGHRRARPRNSPVASLQSQNPPAWHAMGLDDLMRGSSGQAALTHRVTQTLVALLLDLLLDRKGIPTTGVVSHQRFVGGINGRNTTTCTKQCHCVVNVELSFGVSMKPI